MDSSTPVPGSQSSSPKLLDRLLHALLIRGTEPVLALAYVNWARAFIRFQGVRHPDTMREAEIGAFLSHLACVRRIPLAGQSQARQAILFLYREFLHRDLGPIPVSYKPESGPLPRPLLDQMRDVLRTRHYARATEKSYVNWVRRFILFHEKRHPLEMGEEEVEAYLTHLAIDEEVAAR